MHLAFGPCPITWNTEKKFFVEKPLKRAWIRGVEVSVALFW